MGQAGPGGGGKLEDSYFLQKVKLGEGSFGTVWRAVDRRTNDVVAMKQLDKASLPRRGVRRSDIEREIAMMQACEHTNITKLFATFEDDTKIYLALEYCDGGDFGDKVKERGLNILEWEVADWMQQICSALSALHTKGICHRDIKPDNFMVSGNGPRGQLKLADFGLAVYLPRGKLLQEKCGTPAFMAPEQHTLPRSKGYDYAVDVWAAGVSMYMVMFGGRHPFLTDRGQMDDQRLLQGGLDFRDSAQNRFFGFDLGIPAPLRFSEPARDLCSSMVCADKHARCTAEDCLRSAWINQAQAKEQPSSGEKNRVGVFSAKGAAQRQPSPAIAENGMGGGQGAPAASPPETHRQPRQEQGHGPSTGRERGPPAPGRPPLPGRFPKESYRPDSREGDRAGVLPAGTRCRYNSDRFGWLEGVVKRFDDDGTYDLDIKQGAAVDKLAPLATCSVDEAWPAGTLVIYHSTSIDKWLHAVVTSFNEQNKTYNLDIRDNADVDRIRARPPDAQGEEPVGRRPSSHGRYVEEPIGRVPSSRPTHASRVPSPGRGYPVDAHRGGHKETRDGSAEAPLNLHDLKHTAAPDNPRGPGAERDWRQGQPGRRGEGMHCMTREHGLVRIQAFSHADNAYTVLIMNSVPEKTAQVLENQLRAPSELPHAWPAGTKVWYNSASMAEWLPAMVTSFNPALRNYNLDVRDNAAPDRVRPRFPE